MIQPKKSLGQHFLVDKNIARKIVAAVDPHPSDTIIEIGPGTGALTELLAETEAYVVCVEIDSRAAEHLKDQSIRRNWHNIRIVQSDILEFDIASTGVESRPVNILGNLPYNITSQILFHLTAQRQRISSAVLMMQKEVAERLTASPGSKDYGILSVLLQVYAEISKQFDVSPNVFHPKPAVWSQVVKLDFTEPYSSRIASHAHFSTVVKTGFGKRRKMLSNSLKSLLPDEPGERIQKYLTKRPEQLSIEEFIDLSNALIEHG